MRTHTTPRPSFVRALEFVPKKAITRLVLVETLGSIAPPTKQSLHAVLQRKVVGTNSNKQDRTVQSNGAASASASSFELCRPPHAADLHGGGGGRRRQHQQAGAQEPRCAPTGSTPLRLSVPTGSTTSSLKNKQAAQTASYPRPQWGAPAPHSSADGPLHPSCTDHVLSSPHNRKTKHNYSPKYSLSFMSHHAERISLCCARREPRHSLSPGNPVCTSRARVNRASASAGCPKQSSKRPK